MSKRVCPKNMIVRKQYMANRNGRRIKVASTCINDRGAKGKGKKLPIALEKGILKKYGYANVKYLTTHERHKRLRRANRNIRNSLSLFRKLNRLATMNKTQDPELAKIFKHDAAWVRDELGLSNQHRTQQPRNSGSKTTSRNVSGNSRKKSNTITSSRRSNIKRPSGSKSSKNQSFRRNSSKKPSKGSSKRPSKRPSKRSITSSNRSSRRR